MGIEASMVVFVVVGVVVGSVGLWNECGRVDESRKYGRGGRREGRGMEMWSMGRRKESGSAFAFELQPSHARGLSPLPGPFYLTSCGGKRSTGSTIRKTTGTGKRPTSAGGGKAL